MVSQKLLNQLYFFFIILLASDMFSILPATLVSIDVFNLIFFAILYIILRIHI